MSIYEEKVLHELQTDKKGIVTYFFVFHISIFLLQNLIYLSGLTNGHADTH